MKPQDMTPEQKSEEIVRKNPNIWQEISAEVIAETLGEEIGKVRAEVFKRVERLERKVGGGISEGEFQTIGAFIAEHTDEIQKRLKDIEERLTHYEDQQNRLRLSLREVRLDVREEIANLTKDG